MNTQLLKHTIAQVIHLTPARQAESFYTVVIDSVDLHTVRVRITPTLAHLTGNRIGNPNQHDLWHSAVLHVGLAVGNVTEWLDQNSLRYTVLRTWGCDAQEPNWVEVLIYEQ